MSPLQALCATLAQATYLLAVPEASVSHLGLLRGSITSECATQAALVHAAPLLAPRMVEQVELGGSTWGQHQLTSGDDCSVGSDD